LAQALPALDAARLALDDLDRNDVTEIRSFAKPPKPVQTVCECIVVLKGLKEVSWKSAKGMMSEASFLRSLKEMDVDNITQKQVRREKIGLLRNTLSFYGRWAFSVGGLDDEELAAETFSDILTPTAFLTTVPAPKRNFDFFTISFA